MQNYVSVDNNYCKIVKIYSRILTLGGHTI